MYQMPFVVNAQQPITQPIAQTQLPQPITQPPAQEPSEIPFDISIIETHSSYYSVNDLFKPFNDRGNQIEAMILYFDSCKASSYDKYNIKPIALHIKHNNNSLELLDYNKLLELYPNIKYISISKANICPGKIKRILIEGKISKYQQYEYHKVTPMSEAPFEKLKKYKDIRDQLLIQPTAYDELSNFIE